MKQELNFFIYTRKSSESEGRRVYPLRHGLLVQLFEPGFLPSSVYRYTSLQDKVNQNGSTTYLEQSQFLAGLRGL